MANENPAPFSPEQRAAEETAINEFWSWWNSFGADALDSMFSVQLGIDGAPNAADVDIIDVQKEVGGRIAAINDRLIWGFEAGAPYSRHLLTVSAAGDPELRPVARRWLEAAPDDGAVWSFTDLRQADPAMKLSLGDVAATLVAQGALEADAPAEVDPADARVAVSSGHGAVDVRLVHPLFPAIAQLEDGERLVAQLGFTLLQLAVGEEDFGLWLRGFAFAGEEPDGAIPLPELGSVVEKLAEECPEWLTIDAEANGQPLVVATRAPITQLVSPTMTQHVLIQLMLARIDDKGLPTDESKESLSEFNTAAAEVIAEDKGIFVATEQCDGMALMHFFIDPASDAEAGLRALAEKWSEGEHVVDTAYDPAWQRVGHLRV